MRAALAFLTPIGGARVPTPAALPWFPPVGALVGAGVAGAWWVGTELWNPAVGAALAIVVDLALTGMLHVDGLADSADGLLPHLPPERRLEVMSAPDVGAFGVAATAAVLLLRFAVLATMEVEVWLVVGLWASTRAAAAMAVLSMPYARSDGLVTAFRGRSPIAVVAAVLAYAALTTADVWAVIGLAIGFLAVVLLAVRRVGGYTGDVLGAGIVLGETLGLLAASA